MFRHDVHSCMGRHYWRITTAGRKVPREGHDLVRDERRSADSLAARVSVPLEESRGASFLETKRPSVRERERSALSGTCACCCRLYCFFSGAGAAGAAGAFSGAGAAGAGVVVVVVVVVVVGAFSGAGAAGAAAGAGFFSSAFCWQPTTENMKATTRQRTSAVTFFTIATSFHLIFTLSG
jgi:hypothetical protein